MRESHILNIIGINIVTIFDIFANNTDVQRKCNSVGSNDKTLIIYINEVNSEVRFSTSKSSVEISDMFTWSNHELISIAITHGHNNLLAK